MVNFGTRMLRIALTVAVGVALSACSGQGASGEGATASQSDLGKTRGAMSATASPSASVQTSASASASGWWRPKRGATFQIQYSGTIDLTVPVEVYDLDWEGTSVDQVAQLRARGVDTICYLNAGAVEDWRADAHLFPEAVVGESLEGWHGERWLDVRQIDILLPIMARRMDVCKRKGFVAIDPDNTDGWTQETGFAISAAQQVAYQKALAEEAHRMGLGIGLKNDPDQLSQLGESVDFAVNEQCVKYAECDKYRGFLASGKAVFNVEYSGLLESICSKRVAGMSSVLKDEELGAAVQAC